MPMEWLRRIRIGLPPPQKGGVEGAAYAIYSHVGQGGTGYKKIENAPISVREKILIRAWRLSGKTAQAFLEDIENEILLDERKKLANKLEKITPAKLKKDKK